MLPEIVTNIIRLTTNTKTLLTFSECCKSYHNLVYQTNPTLLIIRDVILCANITPWLYIEPIKTQEELRCTFSPPSSNKFLCYSSHNKNNNYDVTSINREHNIKEDFKSTFIGLIDEELYQIDKRACQRKLCNDLLKYYKDAFIVNIGIKRVQNNLQVTNIHKRAFDNNDAAKICFHLFNFADIFPKSFKIDNTFGKESQNIIDNNNIIIKNNYMNNTNFFADDGGIHVKNNMMYKLETKIDSIDKQCRCNII